MHINPITEQEYDFLRSTVYQCSRINLGPNKKELVTARLSKRLRALQLASFADYCNLVKSPAGEQEIGHLIDSISTNHTYFFREQRHLDYLSQTIVPEWLQTRDTQELRIWSAACSSGEEPYSISITLQEKLASNRTASWSLTCTDISKTILDSAQKGIFVAERLQRVAPDIVRKYFQKGFGDWEGYYRVRDDLRKHLSFSLLNLCQPDYGWRDPFRVVFLRNVMIYFDRQTQEEVVNRIHNNLQPGGYLIIGQSESLTGVRHPYKMIAPSIYQRS